MIHTLPLKDIARISTGKYDVNHSTDMGKYPFFTCAMGQFRSDTYSFDDEVIILPGNGANVGQVFYFKGQFEAYQRTYVLHEIKADVKYIFHFFKGFWAKSLIGQQFGSATNYIRFNNIAEFKIPLPPLETQSKIAAILDKADELRQNDRRILAKYDQLAQSVFLEMFGDSYINSKGWIELKLSDIVFNDKIITYGIVQAGPNISDGIPYIRTGDIYNGVILENQLLKTSKQIANSYERSKCSSGDLIMSIRATVGTIAALPKTLDGANLTQGTARISVNPEIANPIYVLYAIRSKGIQKKINLETKGATFKEITLSRLREIKIPIPPIAIQNHFAEIIKVIEKQKNYSDEIRNKSEKLFQSLLEKAFKGELV